MSKQTLRFLLGCCWMIISLVFACVLWFAPLPDGRDPKQFYGLGWFGVVFLFGVGAAICYEATE